MFDRVLTALPSGERRKKMKYSDKLNGYWEEGYHYYLEFRDKKLTVRGYRREVEIETTVSYDARALERGERTVISLKDNVLSRDASGNPFTIIKELYYENGELKLLYYYTIMGETLYTLKKVDHDPFAHIIIRDDEFMDMLQGKWIQWRQNGDKSSVLTIRGNKISAFFTEPAPFHAVSYTYDKSSVYLVPENLIDTEFRGYSRVEVLPGMLTTRMLVCDADMPLSVFAREGMLDKIDVPGDAKRPMRNTMTRIMPEPEMVTFAGAPKPVERPFDVPEKERKSAGARCCPCCGADNGDDPPKFCPECGTKLK